MSSSGSEDELDLSEDSKSEIEDESAGSESESENEENNREGGDKDDEEAGEEEDEKSVEEEDEKSVEEEDEKSLEEEDEEIEEAGDEGIEESGGEEENEQPGLSESESESEDENEMDEETLLMSENEMSMEVQKPEASKKVLKSSGIVNTMTVEKKGNHPGAAAMVTEAISTLNNGKGGTSLQAIKKFMVDVYQVDMNRYAPLIRKFLKDAVEKGTLVQTKGRGASGSFKIAPPKSKRAAKNPVVPEVQAEGGKRKPKAESQHASRKVTKKAVNTVSSPTLKTKKPAVRLPTVPVSSRARKPMTAAMAVEPAPLKRKAKTSNFAAVVPTKKVKPSNATTDQPKTKTAKTTTAKADPPKRTLKNPPAKSKNIAPPQSPVKPKSPAKASKKGMKLPVDKAMKPAAKKLPKD